ncbi:MAG: glycosyltransferase family 39 protein [Candidatus Levybacteria bacterium]|nr:glycosyltransferase family 39 protein [Candidatus Levybacteria bacterium]
MDIISKHSKLILFFVGLSVLYFITRLYNITELPLFTDEAIYTRWSQIARFDAAWRFISLTDGKQPSFVWLDMALMRFVSDPLLAGRLVSVASGFLGMVGIFFLAKGIFKSKKTGLLTSFIYAVFPFTLVYDRMALYESLVATTIIWGILFHVLLVRKIRLDIALILGFIIGFGVLTKSSAFFLIYLFPLSLLLFDFKQKNRVLQLAKWAGLAALSTAIGYGFYSVLRLSPFFHIIEEKNGLFVYPFNEWINHPFEFFQGNWNGLMDWLIGYSTIPFLIIVILSFVIGRKKLLKEKLFLLLWFFVPFVALALFGRILYPRFILFMTIPLLVLGAYSIIYMIDKVAKNYQKVIILLFAFGLMLRSDYYILTDFARAPIPKADTDQFINAWPAGGGVREIVAFLDQESKKGKIYVATEGTFGSLPTYATEIYLDMNKNIEKRGIWPTTPQIPEDLVEKAETMRVFYVFNDSQSPPPAYPVKLIAKYQKGIGDSYMSLYEVLPNR